MVLFSCAAKRHGGSYREYANCRRGVSAVTTSSLGVFRPTFTGPAATGCAVNCNLLTGPVNTPSTAAAARANLPAAGKRSGKPDSAHAMPLPSLPRLHISSAERRQLAISSPSFPIPSVSCQPLGPGCDRISTSAGGATGVKGLKAVDSASLPTNPLGDIEPPDQGLCANNRFVVETNNIGEILVFNTALKRLSAPIPLDTIMGLTQLGFSSGGDPSCVYDSSNGGHWFFTQIVSASPESKGGAFTGCFAGVANDCSGGHRGVWTAPARSALTTCTSPRPTTTQASRATRPCSTTSRRSR